MLVAWNSRAPISASLCAATLALGLAGCGGTSARRAGTKVSSQAQDGQAKAPPGTGSAGQTASPPSAKQFIARADEICRRTNTAIAKGDSEAEAKGKLRKPDTHAAVIQRNQALEEEAIKELGKLTPAAELAGAWKKMSSYREALARELGVFAMATRLKAGNLSLIVVSKKKLHAELRRTGRKAGFKDCATIG